MYKVCSSCDLNKSLDMFEKDKRYRSGYRSQCVQCRYVNQNTSRTANYLKRKYGITEQEYQDKLNSQGHVCDICKLPETRIVKRKSKKYKSPVLPRLAVDHNHQTGEIRGLLCAKCNIALGHLQDDIKNLESAIEYLKRWSINE